MNRRNALSIAFVTAIFVTTGFACSWKPHARDERTIANVKQAQEAHRSDLAFAARALEAAATMTAKPDDSKEVLRAANDVRARGLSQDAFFSGWLFREEQKSDPE